MFERSINFIKKYRLLRRLIFAVLLIFLGYQYYVFTVGKYGEKNFPILLIAVVFFFSLILIYQYFVRQKVRLILIDIGVAMCIAVILLILAFILPIAFLIILSLITGTRLGC